MRIHSFLYCFFRLFCAKRAFEAMVHYIALHAYTATNSDELTFQQNDIIDVTRTIQGEALAWFGASF
jgi:hypothetical protein